MTESVIGTTQAWVQAIVADMYRNVKKKSDM
jgi:hypothetical protein